MCFRPAATAMPKKCPKCGTENDATATVCKKCGEKLPEASGPAMPGAPGSGPSAPAAPGAPGAPAAPGAPKAPGAPGAPK